MVNKVAMAYKAQTPSFSTSCKFFTFLAIFVCSIYVTFKLYSPSVETMEEEASYSSASIVPGEKKIRALTWNIAAINNNPFEYWITNEDPTYNRIMQNVSKFMESPGEFDVQVKDILSEDIINALMSEMTAIGWEGISETKAMWDSDYKNRKIISEFIQDGTLGKKRLASMPDRVTNTINTADGSVVTRPAVINCYDGDLSSMDKFWTQWKDFMFHKSVTVEKKGEKVTQKISDMMVPIKKSKYPAITDEEAKISLPLQTLCGLIFDAILVNMMNMVAPTEWQPLRETMCNKLNRKKFDRTVEILEETYNDIQVQFLQEVASSFAEKVKGTALYKMYDVYVSKNMDTDRDQNSFILLKKGHYKDVEEVTESVMSILKAANTEKPAPVMNGDVLALSATDKRDGTKYIFASFHGDTNGLATIPVVSAVYDYATKEKPDHRLLFGMDANTYAKPESDQQGVTAFAEFYTSKKLNTCYGQHPNPQNFTTFHARTHLQPQLNKAVSLEEKDIKGDKNPKDFILFFDSDFVTLHTRKDNTGDAKYVENMVFPTLFFPSDHGITSTVLLETAVSKALSPAQRLRRAEMTR